MLYICMKVEYLINTGDGMAVQLQAAVNLKIMMRFNSFEPKGCLKKERTSEYEIRSLK